MKRTLYAIAALVFSFSVFTGCSKEVPEQETVNLNVYTTFGEGDGNHDTYQEILKQFEQDYAVSVSDHSQISNEEWKEQILSLFTSGQEPDVLFFFTGKDAESLIENGQVVDLDTIRAVYPSFGSNINTSVLNTMQASDGKNYALPVSGYWEGLFINNDLFTQYKIPIPNDWESFLDAVSSFEQVGIIPIAASLGEVPHYWFEFLIYNYTGPAGHLKSVPTAENPLPETWIKGLTDLQTLYQMNAFPENTDAITEMEALSLFQEKKAAMLLDGSWRVGYITDRENVILIPFPAQENGSRQNSDMIGGFSMGFYITQKAWDDPRKQKAAVDFINSMTTNDSILAFNRNGSASPVSAQMQDDAEPLLQSINSVNNESTAYISAVQDTIDLTVRNALFKKIPEIASGAVSPEEALKEFVLYN